MNLICNGLLAFIAHPEQWDRLRAEPDGLARTATEECLRYDPPVKSTQRIVARKAELCGQTLSPGERIRWIIAAANRDPAVFEDPDRFDIGRQPNPHLSFGSGIHYCLGVALARMEGTGGLPRPGPPLRPVRTGDGGTALPAEHPVPVPRIAARRVVRGPSCG